MRYHLLRGPPLFVNLLGDWVPEKEKEVSQQVRDLLDRDLIEPGHSAWSSPVVLVRKKDGSWRFCVD